MSGTVQRDSLSAIILFRIQTEAAATSGGYMGSFVIYHDCKYYNNRKGQHEREGILALGDLVLGVRCEQKFSSWGIQIFGRPIVHVCDWPTMEAVSDKHIR
jgi:hypothetical protein